MTLTRDAKFNLSVKNGELNLSVKSSIKLVLPEPPSLNMMIDMAKKRTRRSRTGGWMKRSLPVVYDQAKERYELACIAAVRTARTTVPRDAWKRWRLDRAVFRVHSVRDYIEVMSSLKWPVDWLVNYGVVEDDSPRHLVLPLPEPEQIIDRENRCVELSISVA